MVAVRFESRSILQRVNMPVYLKSGKVIINSDQKVRGCCCGCPPRPTSCDVSYNISGTCSSGISFDGSGDFSFAVGFVDEVFFCEKCGVHNFTPLYTRSCPTQSDVPLNDSLSVCLDYLLTSSDRFGTIHPAGTYGFILDAPLSLALDFTNAMCSEYNEDSTECITGCLGCDNPPDPPFSGSWHSHTEVIPFGTTFPASFSYSYTVDGVTLSYDITLT